MADMRTIATAWEARATDVNSYTVIPGPDHRVPYAALKRALEATYIRKLPQKDGWGFDFALRVGAQNEKGEAQRYAIRSYGSDGKFDRRPFAQRNIYKYEDDIVFVDGTFVQHPELT